MQARCTWSFGLRYFLAVAEELNFSRAAERLHAAQPALSAQIRAFETLVGSELFRRTTRKVGLTRAGEMLLADAREIVRRADEALAKLGALARGQSGVLRLGFVAYAAGERGTELLRRFGDECSRFEVELVEARTLEGSQQSVVDRETDAAFVWLPILHEELDSEAVAFERKLLAMAPEHRLAGKRAVRPDDLVEEPFATAAQPSRAIRAHLGEAELRRQAARGDSWPTRAGSCRPSSFTEGGGTERKTVWEIPDAAAAWLVTKGKGKGGVDDVDVRRSREDMAWPPGEADDAPGTVSRDLGGCERRWLAGRSACRPGCAQRR